MYPLRRLFKRYGSCCGCLRSFKEYNQIDKSIKNRAGTLLSTSRNDFYRFFSKTSNCHSKIRVNHANIQMLSENLLKQIFKTDCSNDVDDKTLDKVKAHLEDHNLWGRNPSLTENIDFELNLLGDNIAEHFEIIAKNETKDYFNAAEEIASLYNRTPLKPKHWQFLPGWTKYYEDDTFEPVSVPQGEVLIFDVEVCLKNGMIPVIATALSKDAWYCWVSECLFCENHSTPDEISPDWMIPIENTRDRKLLIGHNVSFDRSFIKEQYNFNETNTKFLDTLSLHVCVSGVTNEQRNYLNTKDKPEYYDWMDFGTTNSLVKVYEFYCGKKLNKATRDLFVEGSLDDIKANFQDCVQYCATDVESTKEVFQVLWPMFLKHVPHTVSFAGMLEMGLPYLPVNENWNKYISSCEDLYKEINSGMKNSLMVIAEEALKYLIDEKYKTNPWLWSLDWTIHKTVLKNKEVDDECYVELSNENDENLNIHEYISNSIEHISEKRRKQLILPGYPKWYRDLCMHPRDSEYQTGPCNISSQTKVTPSLLRMTWNGHPLHHEQKHGWGYLVKKDNLYNLSSGIDENDFPWVQDLNSFVMDDDKHGKSGIDIGIPCVVFYRLPHKNGGQYNVGNPLARDFLSRIEDGTLNSVGGYTAKQAIQMNKKLSFWRNGRKRIKSQNTVWFSENKAKIGVIVPHLITAGTVTRRAVEPTWLTASNPRDDRIGSELKSFIQAPDGYCLVGADVDSQELWIASILGDANFVQMHGSTALSWMTLQGTKADRTDLHSKTADTIGMKRDEAKVFNYSRIYGAGEKFAVRLLMQFNPNLTQEAASLKAQNLYKSTKGIQRHQLTSNGKQIAQDLGISVPDDGVVPYHVLKKLLRLSGHSWETKYKVVDDHLVWSGGSESQMFNKLESIAMSSEPRTPVLDCLVTNALSPKYVGHRYKTSRVNWVVQSSGVDYLHLMLTCMKWLINKYDIDARFCISVHDEVRYIVHENDKYRAALALQISNLLTRSMFSYKLHLYDLPQSVAFFSSVDIDKVWRKEVDYDCVTPSNAEGLLKGYGISVGESLNITDLLQKFGHHSGDIDDLLNPVERKKRVGNKCVY